MTMRSHWAVLVAVGLTGVAGVACGGKSTTLGEPGTAESGTGGDGASGGSGGSGGRSVTGGTGGTGGDAAGGSGGDGASGGSGGVSAAGGVGGAGPSGGKGGGGTGGTGDPNASATKLDLLLMVDNSMGMLEKQRFLASSLPYLFDGLTNDLGVADLHVGVITSSLGDHGSGDICSQASATAENTYNDLAQLVPSVRPGIPTEGDQAFLSWDPGAAGEVNGFAGAVADHVLAAGLHGCGFEASLEAWYRFLVDPDPIGEMGNDDVLGVRGAVNRNVLAQRAAFLRPDSAVVILMLSDENDCSILDENGTQGWLVPFKGGVMANSWRMPRAHAICATAPNDSGCQPCGQADPDPACAQGAALTVAEDAPNLRCFKQTQRFGIDLLYPLRRYVEGLSSPRIDPRFRGEMVPNPLVTDVRPSRLVFLMGIVGVPWQDLSTEDSWAGEGLDYLTAAELEGEGRWPMITGDIESGRSPTDLLMVESVDPRPAGADHPLLGAAAAPAPADSVDPSANPINGHEQQVIASERADLQFACIFPLAEPVPCTMANEGSCDCNFDEFAKNSPVCSYPQPQMDGTQLYDKAYPGLRQLTVLQRLGDQAVAASICPKKTTAEGSPGSDPDYGYNPAMRALIASLRPVLAP